MVCVIGVIKFDYERVFEFFGKKFFSIHILIVKWNFFHRHKRVMVAHFSAIDKGKAATADFLNNFDPANFADFW